MKAPARALVHLREMAALQTAGLDLGLDGIRWKKLIKQATLRSRPNA